MENTTQRPVHVGQNIQRFRLIRGYSQSGLAHQLEQKRNKPVSQQLISDIEDRESIADEELLQQIADVLEVSPEALKTVDMERAMNNIGNTYNDNAASHHSIHSTINQTSHSSLEKLIELFEKDKSEMRNEIAELKKELKELKEGK